MLVQSTEKEITVLPALPSQWPDGRLSGVRVRGGGKLDVAWKDGHLTQLKLQVNDPANYRIVYGDLSALVKLGPGRAVVLDGMLQGRKQ